DRLLVRVRLKADTPYARTWCPASAGPPPGSPRNQTVSSQSTRRRASAAIKMHARTRRIDAARRRVLRAVSRHLRDGGRTNAAGAVARRESPVFSQGHRPPRADPADARVLVLAGRPLSVLPCRRQRHFVRR